ncbi:MAG: hypothetical protein JRF33_17305, partial [Deltaproteobacteria bacterium]|nr:hypothetical protein [Deltaproteobacteria bacterium]
MNIQKSICCWVLVVFALGLGACDDEEKGRFQATIPRAPDDRLEGRDVDSCPVYLEERCEGTRQQRCEIYDTQSDVFVDDPDPLLRRVYLYDRWYDFYCSPQGLTAERVFTGPMPGSTPESEWSLLENFDRWAGSGDAAIWTGAALVSDIFRYTQTGTEADYQRMEDKVRALLLNFDVTGIPGYLARHHFMLLPEGSPKSDDLMLEYGDQESLSNRDNPIESLDIDRLPEAYTQGVPDGQGGYVQGTPMWNGHPSIDQYSGPMMAFPMVYNLLRDEDLKERIVTHMTCYLKRLKRMDLINLQSNPDLVEEVSNYFGGSSLQLDPGDPDFASLDRLVFYYHPGINEVNREGFDRSCPDSVALTATRILDASSDSFLMDMLGLATDLNTDSSGTPSETQIDHFYIANLRGGDASHLMHLAAMAYYFTQDEQYLSFLDDELIANIGTLEVAHTMMAFRMPDWCFKFYGDHISYGTHWQFVTMLTDSAFRDSLIDVMETEIWQKALYNHHSAKFNVMYASVLPEEGAADRPVAIESALRQLEDFGGNDGVLDAPRRTYNLDRQHVIDNLPSGISLRCPTETEMSTCEEPVVLMGIPMESRIISYECDGRPGECVMDNGQCTQALASEGLPPRLRAFADFMWQRSPFDIG